MSSDIWDSEPDYNLDVSPKVLDKEISYEIIGISGNVRDNVEAYLSILPNIKRVNFLYRKEFITDKILESVKVFGYYHAKVAYRFKSKKNAKLLVYIDLGKPVFVRLVNVAVLGEGLNDPYYMYIFRTMPLKQYSIFRHEDYETLKSRMLSRALTLGYFNAHFVKSQIVVNVDENVADIFLIIDTGIVQKYHSINYSGDVQYKDVISNLVTLHPNERFNMERISSVSSAIYDTGYFESVNIFPDFIKSKDDKIPINIDIKRKKFNIVELGIGYVTDEKLRGTIKWNMPLLNERGDSLLLQAEISAIKQDFLASYKIPRKNPLKDFYYIQARQNYIDLNDTDSQISTFEVHYVDQDYSNWSFDYGAFVHLEDYIQGIDEGYAKLIGPKYKLSYYKAFPRLDPRTGQRFNLQMSATYHSPDDINFLHIYAQYKWLTSPTRNSRFLMRYDLGINFSDDYSKIPPSFRFFTGGDTTVRGFGYNTLSVRDSEGYLAGGRYLTVGSGELQVPTFSDIRQTLFADIGHAYNNFNKKDFNIGVGTGVRYISPIGLIKFDVAAGISETHIPFHIHFGIGPDL
ncbi:MAG: autotransporter assembly complex family protein [Succinivibrionaceae bacterium]